MPFYPAMQHRATPQVGLIRQRIHCARAGLQQRPGLLSNVLQVEAARALGKVAQAVLAESEFEG